jgi:lysophospholipase L1-like esterase
MPNPLITTLLGPILLAQGLIVRRTTPILPEPPGPRTGSGGTGPPLRLLILGDSAAAGVGAATQADALAGQVVGRLEHSFTLEWQVIAKTGATTAGTIAHMRNRPPQPFDLVVTSLGVNDVTAQMSPQVWVNRQAELIALLRERFGAQRILLTALPPMKHFPALPQPLRWYLGTRAEQFTNLLEQWAAGQPDCEVVRVAYSVTPDAIAADGFHPGPAFYAEWGAEVTRRIRA